MRFFIALIVALMLTSCSREGAEVRQAKPTAPPSEEQITALAELRSSIEEWAPVSAEGGPLEVRASGHASDGDSVLWAGLLGQCDYVYDSVEEGGRPRRSPPRKGTDEVNSYSRDMFQGLLLCLESDPRPDLAESVLQYVVRAGNRLCPDDTDGRCRLDPVQHRTTWRSMSLLWSRMELSQPLRMRQAYAYGDVPLLLQAAVAEGYERHLVAVQLLLRKRLGAWSPTLQDAARVLVTDQPRNPFFLYVEHGPSEEAAALTLDKCPAREPASKHQWAWQRDEEEQAWLSSMGHDCLFMIDLLTKGVSE